MSFVIFVVSSALCRLILSIRNDRHTDINPKDRYCRRVSELILCLCFHGDGVPRNRLLFREWTNNSCCAQCDGRSQSKKEAPAGENTAGVFFFPSRGDRKAATTQQRGGLVMKAGRWGVVDSLRPDAWLRLRCPPGSRGDHCHGASAGTQHATVDRKDAK